MKKCLHILLLLFCYDQTQASGDSSRVVTHHLRVTLGTCFPLSIQNSFQPYGIDIIEKANSTGFAGSAGYRLNVRNKTGIDLSAGTCLFFSQGKYADKKFSERFAGKEIYYNNVFSSSTRSSISGATMVYFSAHLYYAFQFKKWAIEPFAGPVASRFNVGRNEYALREPGSNRFMGYTVSARGSWNLVPAAGFTIKTNFYDATTKKYSSAGIRMLVSGGKYTLKYEATEEDYRAVKTTTTLQTTPTVWHAAIELFFVI